jgi:hypothetical protein
MTRARGDPASRQARLTSRVPPPKPEDVAAAVREARRAWREFMDFAEARSTSRWVFRGCGSRSYDFRPTVGRNSAYSAPPASSQ